MMTREERQAIKARNAAVIAARKNTDTPAATVAELVNAVGYNTAVIAVAELVNTVGAWDGRVYRDSREWAAAQPEALTREELADLYIFTPSEIHPAHIEQIAQAMREYAPAEEAQEAPAEEAQEAPAEEAQEAPAEVATPSIYERMTAELEARKDRSAWGRGVNLYALELVAELAERAEYEGRNPEPGAECREWMKNGAQDWNAYSWGGSALIYDCDIAERLCTPSELKKTRHGERRPNSREEWLDTQARALYQACNRVSALYRVAVKEG